MAMEQLEVEGEEKEEEVEADEWPNYVDNQKSVILKFTIKKLDYIL